MCEQECVNTDGGFECACPNDGKQLDANGFTCSSEC